MEVIMILCVFGVIAAVIADNRGGGWFGWFVAGFFLGPIGVGLAFTIGKRCTKCQKKIHKNANICPYCQTDLNPDDGGPRFVQFKGNPTVSAVHQTTKDIGLRAAAKHYKVATWDLEALFEKFDITDYPKK